MQTIRVAVAEVVPLGMHGDDAGGHGHDKVLVLTWGSVAVEGSTLDTRICFTMIRDGEAVPGITREKFYKVLVWSFTALAAGVFPKRRRERQGLRPRTPSGTRKTGREAFTSSADAGRVVRAPRGLEVPARVFAPPGLLQHAKLLPSLRCMQRGFVLERFPVQCACPCDTRGGRRLAAKCQAPWDISFTADASVQHMEGTR